MLLPKPHLILISSGGCTKPADSQLGICVGKAESMVGENRGNAIARIFLVRLEWMRSPLLIWLWPISVATREKPSYRACVKGVSVQVNGVSNRTV